MNNYIKEEGKKRKEERGKSCGKMKKEWESPSTRRKSPKPRQWLQTLPMVGSNSIWFNWFKRPRLNQASTKTLFFTFFILNFTFFIPQSGFSQSKLDTLSLEQAIALAFEQNRAIQIQKQLVEIAKQDVYQGNAGLLPRVDLVGSGEYQNSQQTDLLLRTFQPPPQPETISISESGIVNTTLSAGVRAEYLVLGGFAGKYRYQLLQNQQTIAGFQQQVVANNVVLGVSELFLELAKLQKQEELILKNIAIGEDRLQKVQDQKAFGKVTGLAVLNAQTDINRDKNALDALRLGRNDLIKTLNFQLGLDAQQSYGVAVDYTAPLLDSISQIESEIVAGNPELKLAKEGISIANTQISLAESVKYPSILASAQYGYLRQRNDLQQVAELDNIGAIVGVTARFNIYNGQKTRRDIAKAKLNVNVEKAREAQKQAELFAEASKSYQRIALLRSQLERDRENLSTFEENFTRTQDRFENGTATSLNLRDAQIALLNAEITIVNLEYDLLKAFITLEVLKGGLLE